MISNACPRILWSKISMVGQAFSKIHVHMCMNGIWSDNTKMVTFPSSIIQVGDVITIGGVEHVIRNTTNNGGLFFEGGCIIQTPNGYTLTYNDGTTHVYYIMNGNILEKSDVKQ